MTELEKKAAAITEPAKKTVSEAIREVEHATSEVIHKGGEVLTEVARKAKALLSRAADDITQAAGGKVDDAESSKKMKPDGK
jgi:hypothetical protein